MSRTRGGSLFTRTSDHGQTHVDSSAPHAFVPSLSLAQWQNSRHPPELPEDEPDKPDEPSPASGWTVAPESPDGDVEASFFFESFGSFFDASPVFASLESDEHELVHASNATSIAPVQADTTKAKARIL